VNVTALQVFNQLRFDHLRIGHILDANGHSVYLCNVRRTESTRSKDDLEAVLGERTH
jgi:hypothetical protein